MFSVCQTLPVSTVWGFCIYRKYIITLNTKNMNTILISGTAKCIGNKVEYNVIIWASETGQSIQFITQKNITVSNYGELWHEAKGIAVCFFDNKQFEDGAYTQFLDHLITNHSTFSYNKEN